MSREGKEEAGKGVERLKEEEKLGEMRGKMAGRKNELENTSGGGK